MPSLARSAFSFRTEAFERTTVSWKLSENPMVAL